MDLYPNFLGYCSLDLLKSQAKELGSSLNQIQEILNLLLKSFHTHAWTPSKPKSYVCSWPWDQIFVELGSLT